MTQPSLFSADLTEPELADLGGLIAAHGQLAAGPGGTRLSILLTERARALALAAECAARGVVAETIDAVELPGEDTAGTAALLRTERTTRLDPLGLAWTRGAIKSVPADVEVTPGFLRLWALAAGRETEGGYELGLDPHALGTAEPLREALRRAGIAATVVGRTNPVLRVTGNKRRARLAEMVGERPADLPIGMLPMDWSG